MPRGVSELKFYPKKNQPFHLRRINHSFCEESTNDYERIANELVEKCAGLPVAISAIANALKRRDLSSWKDALRRLRKVGPNKKEMQKTVSSTIELSYNLLETEGYSLLQSIDDTNFFTKSKASKSLELEIDIGNGLRKGMEMLVKKAEELHIVG
ncbi:hypothetical protein V6N11_017351 [Hibiscus sabdariffa]|uniref:NB-ARC domain-containing protein n=1 Tax=Hibiscus sabdariffa TaxID=183260 RepID=A0ABR2TYE1_9ROSI